LKRLYVPFVFNFTMLWNISVTQFLHQLRLITGKVPKNGPVTKKSTQKTRR